jgi:hypothetical protein
MTSRRALICVGLLTSVAEAQRLGSMGDSVAVVCPSMGRPDSAGVVTGVVRDARDRQPLAGVMVTGDWVEFTVTPGGLERRIASRSATTTTNGSFVICDVPKLGSIALAAYRGADSTDLIEMQVPPGGLLRRDLYLGSASDGNLRGIVLSAVANRPLEGAQVSVSGLAPTRTNERGEWTLANVPAGTRTLDVRAVSHNAERSAVDVVPGTPAIRTTLSTLRAVLDTMRTRAARLSDPWASGFDDRRRSSGSGHFLTPTDIARRGRNATSELFMTVPGLQVEGHGAFRVVTMSNPIHQGCIPAFYIDGVWMRDILPDDIDGWIEPERILGIEVYAGAAVPPQFSPPRFDRTSYPCGSIVIWTKPLVAPAGGRSWRDRALIIVGAVAFAVAANALISRR